MPWWVVASLLANAAIISVEALNRQQPDLASALMRTWPLIVIAQVCLYFAWHHAPHLMAAWIVFAVGNSLMRLAMVTCVLGEPIRAGWVLGGCGLMLAASWCIKLGTAK